MLYSQLAIQRNVSPPSSQLKGKPSKKQALIRPECKDLSLLVCSSCPFLRNSSSLKTDKPEYLLQQEMLFQDSGQSDDQRYCSENSKDDCGFGPP
jgi:hypothetical protein